MWYCLENEHKVSEIIKLEDDIKNKGRELRKLQGDNRTVQRNMKQQSQLSDLSRTEQFQDRVDGLGQQIAKAQKQIRQLTVDLEQQKKETINDHDGILKLQQDTKKLALIIRDEKQCIQKSQDDEEEFKSLADKNDDLTQKNIMLEEHINKLQAKQEATKKKFKQDNNMYEKRLVEIDQENKVLGVKLKEKE